jgi:hypothetical protein
MGSIRILFIFCICCILIGAHQILEQRPRRTPLAHASRRFSLVVPIYGVSAWWNNAPGGFTPSLITMVNAEMSKIAQDKISAQRIGKSFFESVRTASPNKSKHLDGGNAAGVWGVSGQEGDSAMDERLQRYCCFPLTSLDFLVILHCKYRNLYLAVGILTLVTISLFQKIAYFQLGYFDPFYIIALVIKFFTGLFVSIFGWYSVSLF